MTHLIDIHQLQVKLQQKTILADISFSLQAGDILGLVGPSGCGKTTLLNTLAGFIEQESGNIAIGNSLLINKENKVSPELRNVGMIFQDYALFPHLTVEKNVGFGLDKLSKSVKKERIQALLTLLKLDEFDDRYPHQLSGGQQQRVAIARALAPRPQVLLLDEPFSNIDARLRNELMIEIRQLLKSLNMTAIFVTHNKDEVFTFADKIAVMYEGEILQFGSPIEVSQNPNSWQVADFLQLGSWIPFQVKEVLAETAIGLFHVSAITNAVDNSSKHVEQQLLVKPRDVTVNDIAVNREQTPNVIINHMGITEHGYHYIVNSIDNSAMLSFSRLSFYHYSIFQVGQALSLSLKPSEYLAFQHHTGK